MCLLHCKILQDVLLKLLLVYVMKHLQPLFFLSFIYSSVEYWILWVSLQIYKTVVTFFNTVLTISSRVRSCCTDYFILLQLNVHFLNHLIVNQTQWDRKHTSGSPQYMMPALSGYSTQAVRAIIEGVTTRTRPQEGMDDPLLLGSLALFGAG